MTEFKLVVENDNKGLVKGQLNITFKTKELLINFSNWGNIVTQDLKKMEDEILFIPLLNAMTRILPEMLKFVDSLFTKRVCEAAKYIRNLTDHLKDENTDVCIFTNIQEHDEGNRVTFETKQIPLDIVNLLDISDCS